MFFKYFKTKAARRIRQLEANIELLSAEVVRIGDLNERLQQDMQVIEGENEHLRRQIGGYKAGETRRRNRAQEEPKDSIGE